MEEKFISKFREVLEIKDRDINLSDKFREYPEWSSLVFLSVIAMIDEEYDVIIEGSDFKKLITVADIIGAIKQRMQS
jgi:acyl carrier protein